MPATELVILIGLQGSGKSTFYQSFFAGTHDLVSKDRLQNNRRPARRQLQLLTESLEAGRSVVVDNTNASVEDRADLIGVGRVHGATIVGYCMESRLNDCLERNRLRAGKDRVPDVALFATRKKMQIPSLVEGFDRMFFVRLAGDGQFEVQDWKDDGDDNATGRLG